MAKKAKPGRTAGRTPGKGPDKTSEAKADDSVEKIEETTGGVEDAKTSGSGAAGDEPRAAKDAVTGETVDAPGGDAGTDAGKDAGKTPDETPSEADAPADRQDVEGEILSPGDEPKPNDGFSGKTEAEPEARTKPSADPTPIPVQPPEPVIIRKGGFIPLVLGGIVAAAIGFGTARYVLPEGWPWPGAGTDTFQADVTAKLEAQAKTLADVAAKEPDLAPINTQLAGIQAAVDTLAGQVTAAKGRIDGMEARLTDLEKRPITEGASPTAVAAYERELKALQEAMATQRAEIEKMAKEAAAKEANAEMTAQEAMQRTALSQIQTALDTGNGFAEAAASLTASGVTVPPVLAQVADKGVASGAQLADAFPDAARAALSVARKAEGGGGLGGFFAQQFNARSTAPREGNDADAVLSRAEAAVKEGRLSDAMAELEALSEDARAEMSAWLGMASTRVAALKAADTLAAELN
ncbi:hypothetical protein N4R57_20390 [Rhodobacteraceae bacterium D3-12]|nr:hypothetical protein N4R57_20390 [Rhodobacteraceae bacterium D3-12]